MAVDTSTVQVVMPAMGDSVAEGTVLEWHKQEGDTVAAVTQFGVLVIQSEDGGRSWQAGERRAGRSDAAGRDRAGQRLCCHGPRIDRYTK